MNTTNVVEVKRRRDTTMYIFRTVKGLQEYLLAQGDHVIGFTPTMGALHDGHISLLHRSKQETSISVVSIFVNPTQFNNPDDLSKYPRTLDRDLDILYAADCDVVFVPTVEEMYPEGMRVGSEIDLNGLDQRMEGVFRPGHFNGMAQVVLRLLEIVNPGRLFMGQKDFQQYAIIRHLIELLHLPIKLVMCPTMREVNGLAMSSRNVRLDPVMREHASVIYKTLKYCAEHIHDTPVSDLQELCFHKLEIPGFRPEYFEIVDGSTLLPANEHTQYVVACCAIWAGDVRLIDNMILRE